MASDPLKTNRPLSPGMAKRTVPKTAFKKGQKRVPGSGRKKGDVNKVTRSVKEALVECFDKMGGVEALVRWAKRNQTDFYKLWTRLLPIQITGEGGGPVVVKTKHDLSKLSVEELTLLAKLVDKTQIAAAAAGEQTGGTAVRLPRGAAASMPGLAAVADGGDDTGDGGGE